MNITSYSIREELAQDFSRVCAELAAARLRQIEKDTPANRAAIAECWARIDAVLDMHLFDTYLQESEGAMTKRTPCIATNDFPGAGIAPEEA